MSYGQYYSGPRPSKPSLDKPTANGKRVKQVYPTNEIPHLWAHKTQSNARNAQGNLYFDGDTIYSYGSHFAIARHVTNKSGKKNAVRMLNCECVRGFKNTDGVFFRAFFLFQQRDESRQFTFKSTLNESTTHHCAGMSNSLIKSRDEPDHTAKNQANAKVQRRDPEFAHLRFPFRAGRACAVTISCQSNPNSFHSSRSNECLVSF